MSTMKVRMLEDTKLLYWKKNDLNLKVEKSRNSSPWNDTLPFLPEILEDHFPIPEPTDPFKIRWLRKMDLSENGIYQLHLNLWIIDYDSSCTGQNN